MIPAERARNSNNCQRCNWFWLNVKTLESCQEEEARVAWAARSQEEWWKKSIGLGGKRTRWWLKEGKARRRSWGEEYRRQSNIPDSSTSRNITFAKTNKKVFKMFVYCLKHKNVVFGNFLCVYFLSLWCLCCISTLSEIAESTRDHRISSISDLSCDVSILLNLACLKSLLETMHQLTKLL